MTITRTPVEVLKRKVTLDLELEHQCEAENQVFTYCVKTKTYGLVGSGSSYEMAIEDLQEQLTKRINGF